MNAASPTGESLPTFTANISQEARLLVIGNYLLVKNNCTYMYMTGFTATGGQDYGRLVTFPEYSVAIGHATGSMKTTQGIWERTFSNGLNPYISTATVTLPAGSWVDVNGKTIGPMVTTDRANGAGAAADEVVSPDGAEPSSRGTPPS
jgi:hypothetical protein